MSHCMSVSMTDKLQHGEQPDRKRCTNDVRAACVVVRRFVRGMITPDSTARKLLEGCGAVRAA